MSLQRTRGIALIDLPIGLAISLFIGAAGVVMMRANYLAGTAVMNQNNVNAITRLQMDTLADSLRNAQIGPTLSALTTASISSVTFNTDTAGDTENYYLNTTVSPAQLDLVKTTAGVAAAAVPIVSCVTSLQFTYYTSGGWTTTLSPNYPTSAELPNISAVMITAEMTVNGYSSTITSMVRMRNSPYVAPTP